MYKKIAIISILFILLGVFSGAVLATSNMANNARDAADNVADGTRNAMDTVGNAVENTWDATKNVAQGAGNVVENGNASTEITDLDNIIFKRIHN